MVFFNNAAFRRAFAAMLLCLCLFFNSSANASDKRWVSTMPSYTEILFEIGAGDEIVGVSDYCDRPAAAKKIAKVGSYYTPSAEKIYSLKPSAVFIPVSSVSRLGQDLEKLKLRVIMIPQEKSVADIFETISILAKETGHIDEGNKLINSLKGMLPEPVSYGSRAKVYIDVDSGLWTCGSMSYLNDLVERAGGLNVFSSVRKNYFQAAWESVLNEMPEYIISVSGNIDDISGRPLASSIPAMRNKKIIELDRNIVSRPGPALFPLIKQINNFLRPEQEKRAGTGKDLSENTAK